MSLAVDHGLPTFFNSHLQANQAVTISRRATIGTRVADAYIVAATSIAASWYGVDDPNDLLGGWLSLLQHRDDAKLGRVLALARHCGLSTPKSYVSRVRQLGEESFRPVSKEVTQVILGRDTYLVTTLSEPEAPPLAEEDGVFEQYAVTDPAEQEQFLRQMSVADMDEAIKEGYIALQELVQPMALPFHPDYGLELGETVRLDETSYAHRCSRCAGVWKSAEAEPERCGKRGCQVLTWKTLEEPFLTRRSEGALITPAMIRQARERKLESRKGPD